MAYVVTRPCRIGDWRETGEVLSADDLRGRNVGQMEELERVIRFDPSIPEPKSSQKTVVAPVEGGEDEDLGGLSLKDLKALAADAGVENAGKLRSKEAAVAAIQAARDGGAASDDEAPGDTSGSESEEGGEDEESSSEDEPSSED